MGKHVIKTTILGMGILLCSMPVVFGQTGFPLTPISGADGEFEIVTIDGSTVYRSKGTTGAYAPYMYFRADKEVHSTTAYVEVTFIDIGKGNLVLQYNSSSGDYEFAEGKVATDFQDTQVERTALFQLPDADFRKAQNLNSDLRIYSGPDIQMHVIDATLYLEPPPSLLTAALSFAMNSHIVSTTVFHWYTSLTGQLSGPWRPKEGRENWTGEPDWWKSQIKQMMAANIDVIWIHLIDHSEIIRINLFQALYEMRAEGYNVPKVAPFLDPLVTWHGRPNIDLNTTAGKDSLAAQYIRFFNQYFNTNADDYADDYLAKFDNRPVLDTWHVLHNMDNVASLTREDLESRLQAAFASEHPAFNNGIYLITTAINEPVFSFADERVAQFEINEYTWPTTHNGLNIMKLKAGYWDQNIRDPGDFLPRDGGVHYSDAWDQVDETIDRVYIESWNEYDEGTGIYAGDTDEPFILPGSTNTNTDNWSLTDDPYEYIRTTAKGAARFNDTPAHGAKILRHTFPDTMLAGEVVKAKVIVRNEGDVAWSASEGYRFGQNLDNEANRFTENDGEINDTHDDIPTFGGIFRGRPKTFTIELKAPETPGTYNTKWGMQQDSAGWFGEELEVLIKVEVVTGIANQKEDGVLPIAYALSQNYPNPFNVSTIIQYDLPEESVVHVKIFNHLGQSIKTLVGRVQDQGSHRISWDGRNTQGQAVPAGVYIYQFEAGSFVQSRRMVLMK